MSWEASAGIIGVGFLWLLNMTAFQLNDDEHASIKAFLLMMSFFLSLPLLNFARQLALDNAASANAANMWSILVGTGMFVVFITFLYLFYYWFHTVLLMLRRVQKKNRVKKGEDDDY